MNFDDFKRERDEALRSLDRQKIEAYAKKYGVPLSANPVVFWAAIHKARTALPSLSAEEREKSRLWLAAQGMGPYHP